MQPWIQRIIRATILLALTLILLEIVLIGWLTPQNNAAAMEKMERVAKAVSVLHPTKNSSVTGTVHFAQEEANGVRVTAAVDGISPGKHGFHIHELGDCSALDGTSAGGHYNPQRLPHAGPDQVKRHEGDLGNLEADTAGHANYDHVDNHLSLNGTHSIVGRAVIVHVGEDDLVSQPTGNAGGREACGVIGIAKP